MSTPRDFRGWPAARPTEPSMPVDASPVDPAVPSFPARSASPGVAAHHAGRPADLLTVKETAARLGMSVPSFYRHLPRLLELGLRERNRLTWTRRFDARSVDALNWKRLRRTA